MATVKKVVNKLTLTKMRKFQNNYNYNYWES